MPLDLVHQNRPTDSKDNTTGLQETLSVAPVTWFDAFKGPKTAWVAAGDSVSIDGDHTFLVGKGFVNMQLDYQSNMFEGAPVGEWGANNQKYTIKGKYFGLPKAAAENIKELYNTELCLLAKRINPASATPDVLQFGIPEMFARLIEAKPTSGTAKDGFAGYELTFEVIQPSLYYYAGAITEKP